MKDNKLPIFLAVAALMALVWAGAAQSFTMDGEVIHTLDTNVTRGARADSKFWDHFLGLGAGVSFQRPLSKHYRLLYRGFVRGEAYADYTELSNLSAGATATLQYRASGKLLAPIWSLFTRLSITEYESWLRDSDFLSVGVSVNKGLTDRVSFTGTFSGTVRDSNSRVFDTREASVLFNIDYLVAKRATLYSTYNYLNGDIVSTGKPWLRIVDYAEDIQADDAFGGAAANFYAYRLKGQTQVLTLGANLMLNQHHSLDLSARVAHSRADGDITYNRMLVTAAYLIKF